MTAVHVVEKRPLGPSVTRWTWSDGSMTDVCIGNEPFGPMDFMPTGDAEEGVALQSADTDEGC